jgi:RimJ/RimL family protein N-acetyltransferase
VLGPTLETARLLLRPPQASDFDAYAAFMSDERTARHLGGSLPRSAAWRQFAAMVGAWTLQGHSMFSILDKATGRWIGRAGPWVPEGWPGTEVGWGIAVDHQRKGYAKEAATAAIDWAFDQLGWSQVIHCIEPANNASIAVAKSLGSSLLQAGLAAPAPIVTTWDIYGQSREQWRARRAARLRVTIP